MEWHGTKQGCSSLFHSTKADKLKTTERKQYFCPADRPIVFHRATPSSLLTEITASMPNRHEELDMNNNNFSLLNRPKKTEYVTGLLLVASVTIAGMAFILPLLTVLIGGFTR